MQDRQTFILINDRVRANALAAVRNADPGVRVEIKAIKRTTAQNARMWAMLSDVASQLVWHQQTLSPEDWKLVFLSALKSELRMVPNINGNGFVQLGRSSSDLSVAEMGDLMTIMESFGALHGVVFHVKEAA